MNHIQIHFERLSMFRLAVEQKYKAATRDLARYYYSLETEEDNRKALDYYLQYIEYNPKDTDTLLHIGLIYESGLGVPLNIDLARRYYERAAERNMESPFSMSRGISEDPFMSMNPQLYEPYPDPF